MFHFTYHTPTTVVFGKGAEEQTGALVKAQGCRKVLIHYGGGSVVRSGLLGRIKAALEAEGVACTELGGVVPNPRLSLVYQGIELARREGVDFIPAASSTPPRPSPTAWRRRPTYGSCTTGSGRRRPVCP